MLRSDPSWDKIIGYKPPNLKSPYLNQPPWVQLCEWCGVNTATDGHHMLIKRMKGKPELNHPYNIMWVCHECHMHDGALNGYVARRWWWTIQCNRHTEANMRAWLKSLPFKIEIHF